MLENDGVAQHQVWSRKAGDLIVGIVPRHNSQQRTNRTTLNVREFLVVFTDSLICGELFTVDRIVAEYIGGEFGFFASFRKWFAPFFGQARGELLHFSFRSEEHTSELQSRG